MSIEDLRRDEERLAALVIMASLLTDGQIDVAAEALEGRSAAAISRVLKSVVPPQDRRSGPLLPYIVGGPLKEFAHRVHDAVTLLMGVMSATGEDAVIAVKAILMAPIAAAANPRGVNIGSEVYYTMEGNQSPHGLKVAASRMASSSLYAAQMITPNVLGTGFDSNTTIKGNLPATAYPGGPAAAPRAVASDPALDAANRAISAKNSGAEVVK